MRESCTQGERRNRGTWGRPPQGDRMAALTPSTAQPRAPANPDLVSGGERPKILLLTSAGDPETKEHRTPCLAAGQLSLGA